MKLFIVITIFLYSSAVFAFEHVSIQKEETTKKTEQQKQGGEWTEKEIREFFEDEGKTKKTDIDSIIDKTLEELIEFAIKNSSALKRAEIEEKITKRQSKFIPTPGLILGNDFLTGKTYIAANISFPVEMLFTGKERVEEKMLHTKEIKAQIRAKVISLFTKIQNLQKDKELYESKLEYTEILNTTANEQYKQGIIAFNELIAAKNMFWNTKEKLQQINNDITITTEELKTIVLEDQS
jgi:outer membrane protein TolC